MTQENKDIQPQAEPYIVKSHDIHIDADYADWIADIKSRYRSAQVKAAVKVNAEKLLFNWQLGRDLVQKKAEERWGAGVVEQVSLDLKREFPDNTNFSVRNLWYMKQWYLFYAENMEKLKQSVSEFPLTFACVPWGHHVRIVQHSKNIEEALFYMGYTIREGISRDILMRVMKDDIYKKQGTVPNNFSQHLTPQLAQMARYVVKENYDFGFATVDRETYNESELEKALHDNITALLLEMGNGFAFIGKQKEIIVGGRTRRILKLSEYKPLDKPFTYGLDRNAAIGIALTRAQFKEYCKSSQ